MAQCGYMRDALERAVDLSVKGIAPRPNELKTRREIAIEEAAAVALAEYRLVESGAVTYEALGYDTGNGPAEYKLLEYILIDGLISEQRRRRNG